MSPLDPKNIVKRVKEEGFENVWRESANLLPKTSQKLKIACDKRGTSHPLYDLIQRLRLSFLELGFEEIFNPLIVDESDIYKQYGPEAPIILDRCYYLATLPRPDIGLGKTRHEEIERVGVKLTEAKVSALQKVLRDYKRGDIDSDDLVERIAEAMEVSDSLAMRVISDVFPEFSALRPEPASLTLRSHITSAWFLTLQALQHKTELPLKLFTVDVRFRREQGEDQTHLRVHHAASCVVMDEAADMGSGEEITKALLRPLGFEDFRFEKKKVTSKYYAPGMECEGFIFHQAANRWVEVVDYGLYSPIALARYDLECPVLNVGVGVERLAMVIHNEDDIRRLVYPQFHRELRLSDAEIARMIGFEVEPKTEEGRELEKHILTTSLENADATAPCEFLAYQGRLLGKMVKVHLYENEEDEKLLGAAARNTICVYEGNIVGVPFRGLEDVDLVRKARRKGISTQIRYVDAIAAKAAAGVEDAVRTGKERFDLRVRLARRPRDINIRIGDVARRYITSQKKRIDTSGPIFVGIRAEITE